MSVKSSSAVKPKYARLRQARVTLKPGIKDPTAHCPAKSVLVVDVGGSSVKILVTGHSQRRSFRSGPTLTPEQMVEGVKKLAADWTYEVVSIGYPGAVVGGRPVAESVLSRQIYRPGALAPCARPERAESCRR